MTALHAERMVAAMQLHVQGHVEAAQLAYEALLEQFPDQQDILHSLGMLCLQQKQWEKASDYLHRAMRTHSGQHRSLLPLAQAEAQCGKTEQAAKSLCRFLAIAPNHTAGMQMLYELCLTGKPDLINRLIAEYPDLPTLWAIAIKVCQANGDKNGELKQLAALYQRGIRDQSFLLNYGKLLLDCGEFTRCLALGKEMRTNFPASIQALKLYANAAMALGENSNALEAWRDVVTRAPDDHAARTTLGMLRLLISDGKEGFEDYSAHQYSHPKMYTHASAMPKWDGNAINHALLWSTQGIGDIVMFAGLIPWLQSKGIAVTMATYPKLVPLLSRSFPDIRVIPQSPNIFERYAKECDAQLSLGELMHYAIPSYTPAQHPPYLKADEEKMRTLRQKYSALLARRGKTRLVGISWHTTNPHTGASRTAPLQQWRAFFDVPHIQYISLQYGDHATEIDTVNRDFPGALYADPDIDNYNDIDGLAAQICLMDEVISIDNSTIHLAGALGVLSTLLLPAAAEWRWGLNGGRTRWYENVTLERQKKLSDWRPVMKNVHKRLASAPQVKGALV